MKSLILAATCLAAAASAFVIVPEIAPADTSIAASIPVEASLTFTFQQVKLACPGCPIAFNDEVHTDLKNHLDLQFSISPGTPDVPSDRLLLNGWEIYPETHPDIVLTAPQVMDFVDEPRGRHPHHRGRPETVPLGYALGVRSAGVDEKQMMEVLELELRVVEVGTTMVEGIPSVRVKMIKMPNGELMMAEISVVESQPGSCEGMLCNWIEWAKAKVNGLKNCEMRHMRHKGIHMGHKDHHDGHYKAHHKGHHHPTMNGGQVEPSFEGRHHTWKQLFKNVASYILLPILVGIVAGVTLSILGMMVGTLAVCIWRVLVRRQSPWMSTRQCRRRRGHSCSKSNTANKPVVDDEKAGLMANQDAPPEYVDETPENKV